MSVPNTTVDLRSVREGLAYWAEHHGERIAISDGDAELTFRELHDAIRTRARAALAACDRNPAGSLLPVVVDRSIQSCVSVLACELSRVSYFPVDVTTPANVLAARAERSGRPEYVLTHSRLTSLRLPGGMQQQADVDASGEHTQDHDDPSDDDDIALAVFTSGSTGIPKGVALTWGTRDARWRRRLSDPRLAAGGARAPLILPPDSAWGLDVVCSIAMGYSLLITDVPGRSPSDLVRDMAAFGVTHLDVPPQLLRILSATREGSLAALPEMGFIRVGSEPLRFEFLGGIKRIVPVTCVVEHSYGASECGWILRHRFAMKEAGDEGPVPLGRPANDGSVRFVDADEAGSGLKEVLVTGAISQGYLADPDETLRRFYTDEDGRRWWRSGDLVRMDEAGTLWHEGRSDDAVKVRGKVASPAEVVSVLLRIPGIRNAVVVPLTQDHNVRLVAHVELQGDVPVGREQVQQILRESLPAHLVPSAILCHRELPHTSRGKVDRSRLMEGPHEPW
jgi:L-arginine---[L-arginyl-carrier protein] ligase